MHRLFLDLHLSLLRLFILSQQTHYIHKLTPSSFQYLDNAAFLNTLVNFLFFLWGHTQLFGGHLWGWSDSSMQSMLSNPVYYFIFERQTLLEILHT